MKSKKTSFVGLVQSEFNFDKNAKKYIIVPGTDISMSVVRSPVENTNDPNRELMIKFKYNTATDLDTTKLHENIKKLIYKVMHNNCIMMEFEDVYQEVWKKITKSKHSWNEKKGTRVSTWIVCVANSVVNSLRHTVNRHNSRLCLYDDLEQNECTNNIEDYLLQKNKGLDNQIQDNSMLLGIVFSDDYKHFYNVLNPNEKMVLDSMFEINDNMRKPKQGRIPYNMLGKKLNLKHNELKKIMTGLKEKFNESFQVCKTVDF